MGGYGFNLFHLVWIFILRNIFVFDYGMLTQRSIIKFTDVFVRAHAHRIITMKYHMSMKIHKKSKKLYAVTRIILQI